MTIKTNQHRQPAPMPDIHKPTDWLPTSVKEMKALG